MRGNNLIVIQGINVDEESKMLPKFVVFPMVIIWTFQLVCCIQGGDIEKK